MLATIIYLVIEIICCAILYVILSPAFGLLEKFTHKKLKDKKIHKRTWFITHLFIIVLIFAVVAKIINLQSIVIGFTV